MTFSTFKVRAYRGELAGAVGLAAGVAAAIIVLAVHALVLPRVLVMPVLSVVLMAAGLTLALIARRRAKADAPKITAWEVSGALYFLGCGAAMLSEPEQALTFLEEIRIRR